MPVFNNESTLDELIDRLVATLEPLGVPFEMMFVDDGSRDASLALLLRRAAADPRAARLRADAQLRRAVRHLRRLRSRARPARGRVSTPISRTIPRTSRALLATLDDGHDLVCGVREKRRDPLAHAARAVARS